MTHVNYFTKARSPLVEMWLIIDQNMHMYIITSLNIYTVALFIWGIPHIALLLEEPAFSYICAPLHDSATSGPHVNVSLRGV